jgi:isochorismate hydrolase
MKEIYLTQGKVAIIDDEDFEKISKKKWHAQRIGALYYACSRFTEHGRHTHIKMHHFLFGKPQKDMFCDHINGNGLDNRRENIRITTNRGNQLNRHTVLSDQYSSRYPGVSWHKKSKKWQSQIQIEGVKFYIGCFATEKDAFDAYKEYAVDDDLWDELAELFGG